MMHKKYKKCKMLTLYVDEEQEQMIKTLFDQNNWEYIKIGRFQLDLGCLSNNLVHVSSIVYLYYDGLDLLR